MMTAATHAKATHVACNLTACSAALHRSRITTDTIVVLATAGQEECEAAVRLLDEEERRLRGSRLKYKLAPMALYAGECGHKDCGACFACCMCVLTCVWVALLLLKGCWPVSCVHIS